MSKTPVTSSSADIQRVNAEARRWWAIMSADRDVADNLAAFTAWLDADPAHAAAFDALCLAEERKPPFWRRLFDCRRCMEVAAVAAVAGLLLVGVMTPGPDVAVPPGVWETRLPGDGSTLLFGPGAHAWVEFSPEQRNIRLASGSVIIDAAKDPGRPMVVSTEFGTIRVIGTRFVVVADATSAEVTVTRGKVEVSPSQGDAPSAAVTAAQRVHLTTDAVIRRAAVPETEEIATGWRTFADAPLADIAAAIGSETGRHTVILPSAESRAERVSGRFRIRDDQATLALLQQAYGVHHADGPFGLTVLY